ncbi:hypothetical protein PIB30_020999 [Stylosanthes scabra]|uniref:Zinc finger GRF-type domain-containing protein n=1 Tax=Stylosanthes scabra TaxID=79078 RepID=A0ABU6T9J4_9FABA|nr:hypothetical protein [Stylosanthes scabra]
MDSEGVSTRSKRGGGGQREDRSSRSTQGFFATRVTDDRDGVAPKCHCDEKLQHCKFFMWLDSHTAKFGKGIAVGGSDANEDVDEHFWKLMIENKVDALESRVAAIEKKKKKKRKMKLGMNTGLFVMCLIVVFVCVYDKGLKSFEFPCRVL